MLRGIGVVDLYSGFHVGEDTFRREMNTIIEKYSGYVECWGDVSNMPLDVKLMRAARDSEMELFRKWEFARRHFPRRRSKPEAAESFKVAGLKPSKVTRRPRSNVLDLWGKSSTLVLSPRYKPRHFRCKR